VIYTLAAYSLTFGALGLYWALLAHRRRASAELAALATGITPADPREGFNVGAALLAPFWLLRHGQPMLGLLLLVPVLVVFPLMAREMWIPALFVGAVPAAAGAALGFVANRIGVAHTKIAASAAWSAHQRPWVLAAVILYTVVLPWAGWWLTDPA